MVTKETLLEQFGNSATPKSVERLHRFAYVPDSMVDRLSKDALAEEWGPNNFVLEKYLAVHIPWSIEQGQFVFLNNQLYVAAGSLQTRYGTPLFVAFEPNRHPGQQPWALVSAGSRIAAPQLPLPPVIPECPIMPRGAEVVMMHDHILGDNADRVSFLNGTPPHGQRA